ncbi:MAG: amidohydrolase [Candidatus Aminicenantes bacterium]|nr:amidohydrolase [Candidatus Aminicenantes bacterium]
MKKSSSLLLIILISGFITPAFCASVDKITSQLISEEIAKIESEVIRTRRFLHINPELSNREYQTSNLIASKLIALGMDVQTEVAKTGVVGLLRGAREGFTIAIRSDMDALPIQERTGLSYQSLNKGVMHACGHDIHMAVVLGTAMVLTSLKNKIKGNIKFIFQPAEEGPPAGEKGGASLMIEEGVLKDPPVGAIFGFHVWPPVETGTILFSPGSIMAGSDSFMIVIKGKSAHGALPHEGIDAIDLSAQIIMNIRSVIDRSIDPTSPVVISFGKISGGKRANIIAEQVVMDGTVRTLDKVMQSRVKNLIEDVIKGTTFPLGAAYEFKYINGSPPVYNHPELARILFPSLSSSVGEENVKELKPVMVAEDFSEYSQIIPGFYFFLGVKRPETKTSYPLHSPYFNPDEKSISLGIKIMCHLLLDCLQQQENFADQFPK